MRNQRASRLLREVAASFLQDLSVDLLVELLPIRLYSLSRFFGQM